MPVARYFLFVGGVLLALLFAIDAFIPQQVVVASNAAPSVDKTVVRIRSEQKLPERVVYDTSLPTIVPPAAAVQVAVTPTVPAAEITAHARVRETFAQFVQSIVKLIPRYHDCRSRRHLYQLLRHPLTRRPLAPRIAA